jgi:hypothetical protein
MIRSIHSETQENFEEIRKVFLSEIEAATKEYHERVKKILKRIDDRKLAKVRNDLNA